MRPAAYAAKPSRADARRVMPEACLRHDAFEGHEGEAFVRMNINARPRGDAGTARRSSRLPP
jgi:hypothetical protein